MNEREINRIAELVARRVLDALASSPPGRPTDGSAARELAATSSVMLTTDEAAAFLRVTPRTLANRRSRGLGPPFVKRTGKVLYELKQLESFRNED